MCRLIHKREKLLLLDEINTFHTDSLLSMHHTVQGICYILLHIKSKDQAKSQQYTYLLPVSSLLLRSLPSSHVTYCWYYTKASCLRSNNAWHPCCVWEGQKVFRYTKTQKENEQCPDIHNRAHCKAVVMVLSICVRVCVCVHAWAACLGWSVCVCTYKHTAALFLNACVHSHMYQYVTMKMSQITLVKEIASGSVCECQC